MFKDMFFNYNSLKKWDFCFLYFRNFLFLKIFMHSPGEKKIKKLIKPEKNNQKNRTMKKTD